MEYAKTISELLQLITSQLLCRLPPFQLPQNVPSICGIVAYLKGPQTKIKIKAGSVSENYATVIVIEIYY